MVFIYLQTIISFCHNPRVCQTDRQTDGQTDVDRKTMRRLRSRTVKNVLRRLMWRTFVEVREFTLAMVATHARRSRLGSL